MNIASLKESRKTTVTDATEPHEQLLGDRTGEDRSQLEQGLYTVASVMGKPSSVWTEDTCLSNRL